MTKSLSADFITKADSLTRDLKGTRVFSSYDDRLFGDNRMKYSNEKIHKEIDDLITAAHDAGLVDRDALIESGQWIGSKILIMISEAKGQKGILATTNDPQNSRQFFGRECHKHFKTAITIVRAAAAQNLAITVAEGASQHSETALAGPDHTL